MYLPPKIQAVIHGAVTMLPVCLVVLASGHTSMRAASLASDNAGNYDTSSTAATGFATGSNRGTGFQPFLLTATTNSGYFLSQSSPDSQISTNSGGGTPQAFDLYAFSGGTISATRPFTGALSIGQSFSVSIDSRGVDDGTTVGVSLQDTSGNSRFTFDFLGGTNQLRVTDASGTRFIGTNLDFSVLGDGIRMVFTLTGTNSYSVTATGVTQSTRSDSTSGTLAGVAGSGIDRASIFDNNAGNNHDLFFNSLAITGVPEPGTMGIAGGALCVLTAFYGARRANRRLALR